MNSDRFEGSAKVGYAKLEGLAGDVAGSRSMQEHAVINEAGGKLQEAVGSAKQVFSQAGDHAKDAIELVTGQAKDVYSLVNEQAKAVADHVDPFVKEKPYAALAIAGVVGFILARVFASSGPKIIYVKPHA